MKKIITIAGSNSSKSINKSLIAFSSSLLENVENVPIDLNDYVLPIYGEDFETENGIPAAVKRLDERFNSADGFMISLAEHNGSYAAVFKNTIDWLSRIDMKIWKEKPVLLMATSPGARGGATVLKAAATTFPHLGAKVVAEYSLPNFHNNFSDNALLNDELEKELVNKVKAFEEEIKGQ